MAIKMYVDPGACRFQTMITAHMDGDTVRLDIESECPMVRALGKEVRELEPLECLRTPLAKNPVIRAAGDCIKHASCPVPLAIIKSVEACSGMAVKKDVMLSFSPDV